MPKSMATSIAMGVAAMALLTACGGGSGTSAATTSAAPAAHTAARAGTPSAGGAAQPVSAKDGGFRAVIPAGYSNGIATAAGKATEVEYLAIGPRAGGFATNLTVFRAPASGQDVKAVADRALRQLAQRPSFLPKVSRLSSLRALTVDGESALAVGYVAKLRKSTRHYQVFVVHGQWAYEINDVALPAQYAASLAHLDDVIRSWRWQ